MIPLYMKDSVIGEDIDRNKLIMPGSKEWDLPSITAGLTLAMPLTKSTAPVHSAAGSTGLSTETVSALGTRARETDDYIVQAIENQARFTKYGMLGEVARENLCPYSQDLSESTLANTTVVGSQASPDGGTNADLCTGTVAVGRVARVITLVTNTSYTVSVYAKAGTAAELIMLIYDSSGSASRAHVTFSVTAGVFAVSAETAGTGTAEATSLPGWYKLSATCPINVVVGGNTNNFYIYPSGSGTGNVTLFGRQLEAGAAASTYIPTDGSSKVRAKEDLKIVLAGNIDVTSAGSLMAALTPMNITDTGLMFDTREGDNSNGLYLAIVSGEWLFGVRSGSVTSAYLSTSSVGSPAVGVQQVIGITWATGIFKIFTEGVSRNTGGGSLPLGQNAALLFLQAINGSAQGNAAMQRVNIWDRKLEPAEMLYVYNRDYRGRWRTV